MGLYAIVCDPTRSSWWIQGDEGRVNEEVWTDVMQAYRYALGMAEDGDDIDPTVYFVADDHGPDWRNPVAISN